MKSLLFKSVVAFGLLLLLTFVSFAKDADGIPEKPQPPRLVNDFAGMMNPNQQEELETMLNHYNDSTSTQITVVTIPTLDGRDIAEYTTALGQKWGVGNKNKNNGIVILAAAEEHKIFIATGYGMEGAIPDATAFLIVKNEITPDFKTGDYYSGFRKGVLAIVAASKGEYTNENQDQDNNTGGAGVGGLIVLVIIIIIAVAAIKGGGGRGGGGNLLMGALLGSLLSGGGRNSGWGSGSSGGSSGGGGFGGFGGGSFGGGGAGGSW